MFNSASPEVCSARARPRFGPAGGGLGRLHRDRLLTEATRTVILGGTRQRQGPGAQQSAFQGRPAPVPRGRRDRLQARGPDQLGLPVQGWRRAVPVASDVK